MLIKRISLFGCFLLILVSPVLFAFTLSSTAFQNGAAIPPQYTCTGSNVIPPLSWKDIPSNTQSLVLILSDPDSPSGVWDHWVVYNIPANSTGIVEGTKELPNGSVVLKNSWGNTKYDGPCPPHGTHHYWFYLYALNTTLSLPADASKTQLQAAMQNNIIAQTTLMGIFSK
jgi:Raf kinase inhibitor-like YbhB/YbcL family protein